MPDSTYSIQQILERIEKANDEAHRDILDRFNDLSGRLRATEIEQGRVNERLKSVESIKIIATGNALLTAILGAIAAYFGMR